MANDEEYLEAVTRLRDRVKSVAVIAEEFLNFEEFKLIATQVNRLAAQKLYDDGDISKKELDRCMGDPDDELIWAAFIGNLAPIIGLRHNLGPFILSDHIGRGITAYYGESKAKREEAIERGEDPKLVDEDLKD